MEPKLYQFLKQKILEAPETFVHAIGGIENHVHLAVSVPSTLQTFHVDRTIEGGKLSFHKSVIKPQTSRMAARLRHRQFRYKRFEMDRQLCFEPK
jgi:hypothetical protein